MVTRHKNRQQVSAVLYLRERVSIQVKNLLGLRELNERKSCLSRQVLIDK